MPGRYRRRVSSGAFCVLELAASTLTLEMRPRWLWRRLADEGGRLALRADDKAVIFPVCSSMWRTWEKQGFGPHGGIGLQPEGRRVSYFHVRYFGVEGGAILDALEDAGFTVSWEERPIEGKYWPEH